MLLATTTVADFDEWMKIFSTTSLAKRKMYGSKGALIFKDPNQADRVWVLFDWDEEGWKKFASDPEVLPILKQAGHTSKPQVLQVAGKLEG
jgi:hypothetical protein